MKISEVLAAARKRLKGHWVQGKLYDKKTKCMCSLGAIQQVTGYDSLKLNSHDPEAFSTYMTAKQYLNEAVNYAGVAYFNDTWGRKESEVLAAFDRAIELAQKEEANEGI